MFKYTIIIPDFRDGAGFSDLIYRFQLHLISIEMCNRTLKYTNSPLFYQKINSSQLHLFYTECFALTLKVSPKTRSGGKVPQTL